MAGFWQPVRGVWQRVGRSRARVSGVVVVAVVGGAFFALAASSAPVPPTLNLECDSLNPTQVLCWGIGTALATESSPSTALDCITGADTGKVFVRPRRLQVSTTQSLASVFFATPFSIIARDNERFAIPTLDGAAVFSPAVPPGSSILTVPRTRGVAIVLAVGAAKPGRYHWRLLAREPGQRFVRRGGAILVTDSEGAPIARVSVRRAAGAIAGKRGVTAAQTQEEPPSAGYDGTGVYVDYPEGTDNDVVDIVPVGDPDPFDCRPVQSPSASQDVGQDSSGANSVDMYAEDPTSLRVHAASQEVRPALVVGRCHGTVYQPFHSDEAPGFFGREYGRADMFCDSPVGPLLMTTRIKISKSIGGEFKGRRTRIKGAPGGAAFVTETRTVCRNNNYHRWRASGRFLAIVRARPFVLTGSRRAYSYDYCA